MMYVCIYNILFTTSKLNNICLDSDNNNNTFNNTFTQWLTILIIYAAKSLA